MSDCTACGGSGEQVDCPPTCDGSHVADTPYECRECDGTGQGLPEDSEPTCKHGQDDTCTECTGSLPTCTACGDDDLSTWQSGAAHGYATVTTCLACGHVEVG